MHEPDRHHRRSVRLHGYDYSQPGEYFVTLCTHRMQALFGRVVDGLMQLNDFGKVADEEWRKSAAIRRETELDDWVVMPNHVHGIIRIVDVTGRGARPYALTTHGQKGVGAQGLAPVRDAGAAQSAGRVNRIPPRRPRSLASFVAGLKSAVKVRINELRRTPGADVWQRNYHEHVIRSPHELEIIRDYIRHNPLRWACDRYNPARGVLVQEAAWGLKNWA